MFGLIRREFQHTSNSRKGCASDPHPEPEEKSSAAGYGGRTSKPSEKAISNQGRRFVLPRRLRSERVKSVRSQVPPGTVAPERVPTHEVGDLLTNWAGMDTTRKKRRRGTDGKKRPLRNART
jgi:hypothetical protein